MIIYVEGNIGSGKSTVIQTVAKECAADPSIRVVQEGLDEWLQVKDDSANILERFYQDKERYSFPLQMVILTQRHFQVKQLVKEMRSQFPDFIILIERSPASCDRVFRQILPLTPVEHSAFDYIYQKLQDDERELGVQIRYIYIDTPAETCIQRIQTRARPEEQPISLDYLQKLQDRYEVLKSQAEVVDGLLPKQAVLQETQEAIMRCVIGSSSHWHNQV